MAVARLDLFDAIPVAKVGAGAGPVATLSSASSVPLVLARTVAGRGPSERQSRGER
jgi:hypothetical protein